MWELCICNDLEQSLLLVRQVLQCQEKGTFSHLSVSELTSETSTYTSQITLCPGILILLQPIPLQSGECHTVEGQRK